MGTGLDTQTPYPLPRDEEARLAAVRALGLLDTPREERFDRISRLAKELLDVPIALITLIDADRQWYKSCHGLTNNETPRSTSFCTHAIMSDGIYEVTDARTDPLFAHNPSVLEAPHIRFYAGRPIHSPSGFRIGTLCVIDRVPRSLTQDERRQLHDLAAWVELELQAVAVGQAVRETDRVRHQLLSILDSAAEGIVAINTDGFVTLANPAAEQLTGWSGDGGLRGRQFHETVHGQFPDGTPYPEERCPVHIAMRHGRTMEAASDVFWRRDGSLLPVSRSAAPLMEDGELVGGVVVFEDVTEQREVERLKDEFVSVISHELRTPLTSIRGSLGLATSGVFGELPVECRELVDMALANTERLVRLVTDILDYERLTSGRLVLTRQEHSLRTLVVGAIETVRGAAEAGDVRLEIGTVPEVCACVDGDRVIQVLVNLLGNAIKFSDPGTPVRVEAEIDPDNVHLHVIDTGRGIPADVIDHIFERFAQADASDAREKAGTGLGLAITKSIAEAHGGTVSVRSAPGVGSTFTLTVPRHGEAH